MPYTLNDSSLCLFLSTASIISHLPCRAMMLLRIAEDDLHRSKESQYTRYLHFLSFLIYHLLPHSLYFKCFVCREAVRQCWIMSVCPPRLGLLHHDPPTECTNF